MQPVEEDSPGRLEHFDKDVVVDVRHEVSHLVVRQIEAMKLCK